MIILKITILDNLANQNYCPSFDTVLERGSVSFQIPLSESKILLQQSNWSVEDAIKKRGSSKPSTSSQQGQGQQRASSSSAQSSKITFCDVCAVNQPTPDFSYLGCRHPFCKGCWEMHFECQIMQGISTSKSYEEELAVISFHSFKFFFFLKKWAIPGLFFFIFVYSIHS